MKAKTSEGEKRVIETIRRQILNGNEANSEYGVIESILQSDDRPEVICMDFDEVNNVIDIHTRRRVKKVFTSLRECGYRLLQVDGDSVVFRHDI